MRLTLVVVMVCAFACNKKQEAAPAKQEAPKTVDKTPDPPAKPAHDPWDGAPAEVKTELGAKTGAKLSKIDAKAEPAALTAKVDPKTIDQPVAPQGQIESFTGDAPSGFSIVETSTFAASACGADPGVIFASSSPVAVPSFVSTTSG